jgi:hypothetical protein
MRGVLVAAALLVGSAALAQTTDPLASLRFLEGNWRAIDTAPGESGTFAFTFGVQNHVLVRTNEAIYDATATAPAARHDDLMIVYAEKGAIKADYFDNEGHVIRYTARVDANRVAFVSDPDPNGPRYRLTYSVANGGVLEGGFEIAPPGASEAFKPYLSWKARRQP